MIYLKLLSLAATNFAQETILAVVLYSYYNEERMV